MNCDESLLLIEAYSDGELDLVSHVELEAHLQSCPDCALQAKSNRARRAAIRDAVPRFRAPPQLRAKVHALVRTEAPTFGSQSAPRRVSVALRFWKVAGLAASFAIVLIAGYSLGDFRARTHFLLDEAVADHVRSLEAGHLLDVASTDQHAVKPWFAGKLDFSPPVADLADAGFPLVGGRLDRIDGHPAAALVFRRRLHAVNLFVWPAGAAATLPHPARQSGYNVEGWSSDGLSFLVVSEIPKAELDQFIEEYRRRTN